MALTITQDHQCTDVITCELGRTIADNISCSCPSDSSCESCYLQNANGRLLIRQDQEPQSEQLDAASECAGTTVTDANAQADDYTNACQRRCENATGCVAFFVYDRTTDADLKGSCCLKKRCACKSFAFHRQGCLHLVLIASMDQLVH